MPDDNSQQTRVLPETDQLPHPCPSASFSTALSTPSDTPEKATTSAMRPARSEQPSVSQLASYGIKVRDFAYESTLPPIAPVLRLPRQIQPGPRPLKRVRKDYDDNEEPYPQPSSSQGVRSVSDGRYIEASKKSKPLERKLTEPALDDSNGLVSRARTYTDLGGYEPPANTTRPTGIRSFQLLAGPSTSQSNPHSQPTPLSSQDSEPYIDTPVVTPNGSLQWPSCPLDASDTSCTSSPKPTSAPADLLGSASPHFTSPSPLKAQTSLLLPSLSIGSINATPSPPVAQPIADVDSEKSPEILSADASNVRSPRYFLRKRPGASPETSSRTRLSRLVPPSRPPHFSIQAAHSASKSHDIGGSPRARTLRRHRKEGSIVAS